VRRLLPFLAVFLFVVEDARASSCVAYDARTQLKAPYVDAAFLGRVVAVQSQGNSERRLTFRVDRVVKGRLGETVEIREPYGMRTTSYDGMAPGEPVALMLSRQNEAWSTTDCLRFDPGELADATEPLPRPPGRGEAAFLAGGGFGDASIVALDRRGRTIAYGFVRGGVAAVCPGGRRFLSPGADRRLQIRRTRDFRTIGERAVPLYWTAAHCQRDGVYVAGTRGIHRGSRRIWSGKPTKVAFHGRRAFVLLERSLVGVDLRSGRARTLVRFALGAQYEPLSALAVNQSGTRVAILASNQPSQPDEPPSQIAVYDTRSRDVRIADLPGHIEGSLTWTSDDHFAVLPTPEFRGDNRARTTLFFDARLRPQGRLAGWTTASPATAGGGLFGIVGHRLERATPEGFTELGHLPGSFTFSLHRLPDVEIRASRRVPRF
jgi:hypothetical protein